MPWAGRVHRYCSSSGTADPRGGGGRKLLAHVAAPASHTTGNPTWSYQVMASSDPFWGLSGSPGLTTQTEASIAAGTAPALSYPADPPITTLSGTPTPVARAIMPGAGSE
jgi:hypothetical protein